MIQGPAYITELRANIVRLEAENARLRQTVNDQAAVIERLTRGRPDNEVEKLMPELSVIRRVMCGKD